MFQKSLADRLAERREDKGFTLIELLVVMIVIGILAAIAIPLFLNQKEKAKVTGLKNDLRNAATYVETWAVDHNGMYEQTVATVTSSAAGVSGPTATGAFAGTNFQPSANTGVLTVTVAADKKSFCINGDINPAGTGTAWSYDSDRAVQLAVGTCTA